MFLVTCEKLRFIFIFWTSWPRTHQECLQWQLSKLDPISASSWTFFMRKNTFSDTIFIVKQSFLRGASWIMASPPSSVHPAQAMQQMYQCIYDGCTEVRPSPAALKVRLVRLQRSWHLYLHLSVFRVISRRRTQKPSVSPARIATTPVFWNSAWHRTCVVCMARAGRWCLVPTRTAPLRGCPRVQFSSMSTLCTWS